MEMNYVFILEKANLIEQVSKFTERICSEQNQ